ncbi:uncharacterized protein KRP23_6992 [Phytophthora ramorum]|uniref:uncharacterized protein n=1 Tax=Phytophthora ramorum TaxID=164328 RepID=UPI0030A22608|nr:hypothetical protein KRP23_6992 [Phytophthora ramorum]
MVNISVDVLGSLTDSLGLHQPLMGYSTANDNRRGESDFFALSVSGINTAANTAANPSQLVTPFAYGTPVGKTWIAFVPLLVLSVVRHYAEAHTWIDCFDTDRSKLYDQSASYIFGGSGGNGFCEGYGAGYPGRGNGDIGTEYTYKLLKNEVEAGSPVCQNVGSTSYSDWRKRLSVAPGQTAYFAYLPNGHIVKDKKGVGTQHGVYWTGQVGTSLTSTLDMTPEHLLDGHTMDYDDGNCGETVDSNGNPGGRAGDGKPCIGSFVVPEGTAPGVYNMVWYWTFWLDNESAYKDQQQSKGYFGAAYSTCFELEVTGGAGNVTIVQQAAPSPWTPAPPVSTPAPDALVGAEAALAGTTPPPAATPVPEAMPATTAPIPVEAQTPGATPAPMGAPASPLATPAPTTPLVTPAPTTPLVTPAPTAPMATPAPTNPMETSAPTLPIETPVVPMATPAPATPIDTPAAPAVTPAASTPSPETPAVKGSICRRRA